MKQSDLYLLKPLMWPCYVYEDFISTLNRMKREEQNWKKEKVTPCTLYTRTFTNWLECKMAPSGKWYTSFFSTFRWQNGQSFQNRNHL